MAVPWPRVRKLERVPQSALLKGTQVSRVLKESKPVSRHAPKEFVKGASSELLAFITQGPIHNCTLWTLQLVTPNLAILVLVDLSCYYISQFACLQNVLNSSFSILLHGLQQF